MENPKHIYGQPDWPPRVSVEQEDCVDGHFHYDEFGSAREELKGKLEEGR